MSRDPVTDAVRAMLEEKGALADFAEAACLTMGWRFANPRREAPARIRQMLNEQDARHLPARLLPLAIRVTGLDYITPLLQREALRAEMDREEMPAKPGIRPVRRDCEGRQVENQEPRLAELTTESSDLDLVLDRIASATLPLPHDVEAGHSGQGFDAPAVGLDCVDDARGLGHGHAPNQHHHQSHPRPHAASSCVGVSHGAGRDAARAVA